MTIYVGASLAREWVVARMAASYRGIVGAGLAREQEGAGIGEFLVPELQIASKARSYREFFE